LGRKQQRYVMLHTVSQLSKISSDSDSIPLAISSTFCASLAEPKNGESLDPTDFSKNLCKVTFVVAFYPGSVAGVTQNLRTTAGT
jgi:hypothetical protein